MHKKKFKLHNRGRGGQNFDQVVNVIRTLLQRRMISSAAKRKRRRRREEGTKLDAAVAKRFRSLVN